MDAEAIRATVLASLTSVAPDVDPTQLEPDAHFRDQFDFDSVDQLNFVLQLERQLDIKISELEYPKYASVNSCVKHLQMALKPE